MYRLSSKERKEKTEEVLRLLSSDTVNCKGYPESCETVHVSAAQFPVTLNLLRILATSLAPGRVI